VYADLVDSRSMHGCMTRSSAVRTVKIEAHACTETEAHNTPCVHNMAAGKVLWIFQEAADALQNIWRQR
jgi:hypothetical protein